MFDALNHCATATRYMTQLLGDLQKGVSSVSDMNQLLGDLQKGVATHSSLDNNDMRQDTNTGHCTSHHTNSLIFQPSPPIKTAPIIPLLSYQPDTESQNTKMKDLSDYKIGKLVPLP